LSWFGSLRKKGIGQLRLMEAGDYRKVKVFVAEWISSVICRQGSQFTPPADFTKYHLWQESSEFPHSSAFVAPSRFVTPPHEIREILLGQRTRAALAKLGLEHWEPMDEGMGWLGYRIIRPGYNDGYPLSKKNWGASKGVISFWIPVFGFGQEYALQYVEGSHLKEYRSHLPETSKFTKNERRLSPEESVQLSSQHVAAGNGLIYGPDTLHSENVPAGSKTRINLEFRAMPV
jgi:hypothetical protein